MDTVELIVYFATSIIVGAALLSFLSSYSVEAAYENVQDLFTGSETSGFEQTSIDGFTQRTYSLWQDCQFGRDAQNMTLYVEGSELNKSTIFNRYKKINLCDSISSASQSCGDGEDITLSSGDITLPSVVVVTCNASGLMVS